MKLIAACAFGLEAVVKRELQTLGYTAKIEKPGRISFQGEWDDVCRANIWLRTADRVLIEIASFPAGDFDALFETARDIDWAQWIPAEAAFPVTGRSRKSQLTSVPAIQRTVKKAIVEALRRGHATSNLPESGATFRVDAALLDDTATLTLDTTGASLHKRGYRKLVGPAPLKETLAAAMISLSVWNPDRPLIDPFCGSGTIPIEAALIGLNIAPGQSRDFTAVHWPQIGQDTCNAADVTRSWPDDRGLNCRSLELTGTRKFCNWPVTMPSEPESNNISISSRNHLPTSAANVNTDA